MKMNSYKLTIIISLLLPVVAFGQLRVTKVENKNVNTSQDGFYYSLPQTIIKVDVVYQKIDQIKGPLSSYTEEYLGTAEYIRRNEQQYKLIHVDVHTEVQADPNQIYWVQFPMERSKDNNIQSFTLSDMGTLIAVNEDVESGSVIDRGLNQTLIYMEGKDDFQYNAAYNRKKKVDTVVRKITIDTLSFDRFLFKTSWVDKSLKEKANEAALQINKIRDNRFNLITGYHEVNFGEGMAYMDGQLKKLENDYLELFLGKEVVTIEKQTIYYIPNKNTTTWELFKFPDGGVINISITPSILANQLPAIATEKMNTIYYRIPAPSFIEISSGGKVHHTSKQIICQLGANALAPLDKTKLRFDVHTGNLKKIDRSNN